MNDSEVFKLWYETNKERILLQQKLYREKNKEKIAARSKLYIENNKAARQLKAKILYISYPERLEAEYLML